MADIVQMLADVLKISPQVMSQYSMVSPLEQLFYLFFFPTLFIIVFIYIIVTRWMYEHKGLSILIAVAIYAFIIFQGMYNTFIILSKFWLFMLILLGVLWFIFRPKPKGGGGGGAKGLTSGGRFSGLTKRAKAKMSGREKELVEKIEKKLNEFDGIPATSAAFSETNTTIGNLLSELEQLVRGTDPSGIGFKVKGEDYNRLQKKYLEIRTKKEKNM